MTEVKFLSTGVESLFDYTATDDVVAIQETIIAGFDRLAALQTEAFGEDVSTLDAIDGFIEAVEFARAIAELATAGLVEEVAEDAPEA